MNRRALLKALALALSGPVLAQGACTPTPALAQGPYYLAGVPRRRDLREGEGVPFHLRLLVQDALCRPLRGARVDLWHADPLGRYSGFQMPGVAFRGYELADEGGGVEFLTHFPGWYPGRTPHFHLRVEAGGRVLVTQLFFPEEVIEAVYARPPYRTRGLPNVRNRQDGIFRADLLLSPKVEGEGFGAGFTLVLR
ncbi:protocatechuate 3,4-dioxygenase beta subunit [Thermus oshimai JL-2]|uniref:Protocatechuate 3,4-dioxygenase beta subunit n=1 Tax=Thermus oshimai JL-2 TaxID=751945 RepID=K7QY27_THEOS|nr:protocatechuate 3,4-dioxygenase subunit beta [Thermus oshimai]AFV75460.1 protocatechuate 3,4-dioxygenase beta subunit [Thermus oshimai JL-2]